MKTKSILKLCYIILLMTGTLLYTGCVKDGEMGPQGDKGVEGPQGEQGNKGAQGKDAETDMVEVYASGWFNGTFTNSGGMWRFTVPAPQITQEVLNEHVIHVYWYNVSGNFIYKLPYKGTYLSNNKIIAQIKAGEIEIQSTYNVTNSQYRFVISKID